MKNLEIYDNIFYVLSSAAYTFDNLDFILTCSACPEQYDVVLVKDYKRYQVGYVRLRHGRLRVECPDVFGEEVYSCIFDDAWKGCFDDEEERLEYLEKAAVAIQGRLRGV